MLDEASYWAEKLLTDINLSPLMPDEDHNFGGSLVSDFRKMMTSRATEELRELQWQVRYRVNGSPIFAVLPH